jgi:UBX domain
VLSSIIILILIRNGELKEYLAAGVPKEDFFRRMNLALAPTNSVQLSPTPAAPQAVIPSQTTQNPAAPQAPPSQPSTSSSSNLPLSTPAPAPAQAPTNPTVESRADETTDEKKARLEAHKQALRAKEEARRAAEIRDRRDEIEGTTSKASADKKYAMMQKKRAQDARDERARILKRVEDDKADRREREAQRKAEAKALAEGLPLPTGTSSVKHAKSTISAECALQIRMFDGSTIRSRFPSSASLRKDVRPWVDENKTDEAPYNFKWVLTPLPNKNIETSEEEKSLQSLGLTPSATLVIVPIAAYSSAYQGGSGFVSRGVSAGYGLLSSGVGMVTGLLGGFLGGNAVPASEEQHPAPAPGPASNANPSINVRTLRDQQSSRAEQQQFYNGNALNFEPRKDEDDKKED